MATQKTCHQVRQPKACSGSIRVPLIPTLAPALCRTRATSAPIPPEAPVIRADFFAQIKHYNILDIVFFNQIPKYCILSTQSRSKPNRRALSIR